MSAKKRRVDPGLIQRLRDEPYRFEFFQAVRLLLAHYRQHSSESDRDVLGQVIQFRSSISLVFPPSEIESLEMEWEASKKADSQCDMGAQAHAAFRRVTVVPAFIGLTGPAGVLPRHYTQHAAEREIYYRDSATRGFLDIFTSRAVALFYQSWLKYRLAFQYEVDRRNNFLPLALNLAGVGLRGTRERLREGGFGIADESLAYYAGALRTRPRSAQWFARVCEDYFRAPARMEQFIGQWLSLPDVELTRIGSGNCHLGNSAFCGARIWDRQARVRLTLGPMRRRQFSEFLPGATASLNLGRLFELMVGITFDCEVRLVLDKRDVSDAGLGAEHETRLGWNSWIKSTELRSDSRDTAYLLGVGRMPRFYTHQVI